MSRLAPSPVEKWWLAHVGYCLEGQVAQTRVCSEAVKKFGR